MDSIIQLILVINIDKWSLLMSDDKQILTLNHDVNNQLGVAMGNFELMMMKNPALAETTHAQRLENSLLKARDLSKELAQTVLDAEKSS